MDGSGWIPGPVLAPSHPRPITRAISGYGGSGAYRDHKAYALLVQSAAGPVSGTGILDTLSKAGPSIADVCVGMYTCSGMRTPLGERGHWASLGSPVGTSRGVVPAVTVQGETNRRLRAFPPLGEHTDSALARFDQRASHLQDGGVSCPQN
ncbi:hypothetical protein FNJ62_16070 [Streptomyces benahoarensis]|uniref:Uncharacterized protein n=2 Tax=Streptomyces benahoarensis TaxID=2595054 RepID=A0A553ZML2_9ACTN|nr:hypothetical protein FNJ62_16070 [Streptomyces benahoarensis]TSB42708.1 hypothetical protein FNZ23_08515 [Streptomyces benahoarensis]